MEITGKNKKERMLQGMFYTVDLCEDQRIYMLSFLLPIGQACYMVAVVVFKQIR